MFNRRKFMQWDGGLTASITIVGGRTEGSEIRQEVFTDQFNNLFTKMKVDPEKHVEILRGFPQTSPSYITYKDLKSYRHDESDYLLLPKLNISAKNVNDLNQKINRLSTELILTALVDRNVVVYDSESESGKFSLRLLSLMSTVMRRDLPFHKKNNRLTDIFIRKSKSEIINKKNTVGELLIKDPSRVFGININLVDDYSWDSIESYYFNELGGSYAPGKSNLLIGVGSNREDFIQNIYKPIKRTYSGFETEIGLGVLNYNNLLLGSF